MKTNMMKVVMKSQRRAENLLKVATEKKKSTAMATKPKQPKERAERMAMKRVTLYF